MIEQQSQSRRIDTANAPLVLIVDDDEQLCDLLAIALDLDGYRVHVLNDGEQAMTYLTSSTRELPDLLISDLAMPKCSGIHLLGRLVDVADVQVISMTAFGDEAVHAAARRLGAAFSFDKPFDLAAMRAAVRELVPRAGG